MSLLTRPSPCLAAVPKALSAALPATFYRSPLRCTAFHPLLVRRHLSTTSQTDKKADEAEGAKPAKSVFSEFPFGYTAAQGGDTRHFRLRMKTEGVMSSDQWVPHPSEYRMHHPIWSDADVENVTLAHHPPEGFSEHLASWTALSLRALYNTTTGYSFVTLKSSGWLRRMLVLESISAVPGIIGAMSRHLQCLRKFESDQGWIHTLLEESENERMHLMFVLDLKHPSVLTRINILAAQFVSIVGYGVSYLISPRYSHRLAGYLNEEAVQTYTTLLNELDSGKLPELASMSVPPAARDYWCLAENATIKDVILAMRADESYHRAVNHTFARMKPGDENPFLPKY
ncbi:unnamed protein product [Vitrella brassicaformis CCMP3155]|uniref:Alternative oxidase n=2 Tax=Vitrella brassicaformis TaxID=1169539 RepID=A0A0G4FRL5_VITBC|nr:unnamed protein product [Vitrella brassicaformis CCMP3155]|mmetsp:Transcript_28743/g.82974  ORF Transcript_28743/g.82974 Transcript_28743/m.82974 type:complete len:343 (+) Transcript_28743:185-1213(+)|eukprot:CEM16742.1 unnamed protein product [Vitrella brassicaformis CCMP3155]